MMRNFISSACIITLLVSSFLLATARSIQAQQDTSALPAAMTFRLEPDAPVIVRARVDGVVKRIIAPPGEMVTARSPLVEFDSSRLDVQRDSLKEAFLRSYATYRQETKAGDPLKIAQSAAQSQADATAYDLVLFDIQQHTSLSPIDGMLSEVTVKPGQFVHKGDTIASVTDARFFTVDIPLPMSRAKLNDRVAVVINGKLIDGAIQKISPLSTLYSTASRLNERLVSATLLIPNNGQMAAGLTVLPVQSPYAIVPTKALGTDVSGNTILRIARGTETLELPAVTLSPFKEGQQIVMADLQPGDLASVPGPVENVPLTEPLTELGSSADSQLASTETLTTSNSPLLSQCPLADVAAPEVAGSDSQAPISLSDLNIPPELAGVLSPDQLPLPDLNLEPLTSELNLSPSDMLAIEQLRSEFQTMLDEKGLHIKELVDLKDIEGIAEYEQFLVAIRALNQDYAQQLLTELPEDDAADLKTSLLENVGLNALPKDALKLDESKLTEIGKQFETEQFDVVKKLLTSEATMDQARETIKGLLDKKDQAAIDAVAAEAKNALTVNMQKRQARFEAGNTKAQQAIPPTTIPAKTATDTEEPQTRKPSPKIVPPPLKADVDYMMIGMFAFIGLIVVGALGYFLGIFKLIKSLMTPSPGGKKSKKRKGKLKNVHRVEVGPEKSFQTIRDALTAVLENPYAKDETPWDRHEVVLQPGVYKETIHLDENYPAGIRIMTEDLGQVTIVGDGIHPVIDVNAVTDFGLEGLVIDGDAAPTVIQLRDVLKLVSFTQVIITGYKQFGLRVSSRGGEGELNVTLSETVFLSSMLETTGMFVDFGNLETNSLNIEKSRFHGQMQTGIQFRAPLQKTSICESIFAYLGTAISMAGTGYPFEQLKLSNNTFYRCGKALFFRRVDTLSKATREVLLDNNLFSQSETADIAISDVVDADQVEEIASFIHEHSNGNLTDLEAESDFTAGTISMNGKAARVFPDFKFRSVEIDEPDFLMPTPDSPQRQAWSKKGSLGYVGALGPKSVVRSVMEPQS